MCEPKHTPGQLEQDLCNLLSSETSVLAPDDAPKLARSLVENLPPEFDAAPDMLIALENLVDAHDTGAAEGAPREVEAARVVTAKARVRR